MAEDVKTFIRAQCDHREITAVVDGSVDVAQLPIQRDSYGGSGEAGSNRLGDLKPGNACWVLKDLSVWITKL
jgi:hypothetical protein